MRIIKQGTGKHAGALPKTAIRLLQGDDIGIHFTQHGNDAIGITPPISADSLVNIIAGECQFHPWFTWSANQSAIRGSPAIRP